MPGWVSRTAARVVRPWHVGRLRVASVVAVVATVIAAVMLAVPQAASADGTGPAPLLNADALSSGLYAATSAQAVSLADLEQQAITNTLSDHGLPASDADAAGTWGRSDAEAELWALLVQAIQAPAASRTTDQQNAVDWLSAVAQRQNVQAADDAGLEYAEWDGIGATAYQNELKSNPSESALASFLSTSPVSYTDGGSFSNPSASTDGGYCVYQPPAPDQSQYTANIYTTGTSSTTPQTCFTPCTSLLGCSVPEPSYDQFVAWGTAEANSAFDSSQYAAASESVAEGIAFGAAATGAAAAGIAVTASLEGALTGTALAAALSPFGGITGGAVGALGSEALAEASGAIAATEVGGVVTIVLSAIAVAVIASINLAQGLQEPGQLASLITGAPTAPPPDLGSMLANSGPALFGLFIGATQPEPLPDTCDNSFLISFTNSLPQPCLNAPAIPAPSSSDVTFTVAQKGSSASTQTSTITWADAAQQTTNSAYAFGNWFVQTEKAKSDGSSVTFQALQIHYTDWGGTERIAWLLGNSSQGYEFLIAQNNPSPPVNPSTCQSNGTCSVSQAIDYVGTDGNDYSATLPAATGIPLLPPSSPPGFPVGETLSVSPASPGTGQQATFTASFSALSVTGTVNFVSDLHGHDTTLCANVPVANTSTSTTSGGGITIINISFTAQCTATFATPQSTVAYATFTPAANSELSSDQASVSLNVTSQWATTTSVSSSSASPQSGQPVTFVATVSDGGGPVPGGTVTFSDGSATLCANVPLSSSAPYTANCSAAYHLSGQQTVTASYGGDAGTAPSSGTVTQTVLAATTTSVSSSAGSPVVGQPVTLTATVSDLSGLVPGGTVTFSDGSGTLCAGVSLPSSAPYIATCSVTYRSPGQRTVTASYGGDAGTGPSTSMLPLTVAKAATAISMSGTPATPLFGQAVTFTAGVAAASPSTSGPALTGTVSFTVDGKQAGAPVPLVGGSATSAPVSGLAPGVHMIVASYSGDSNYTGSSVSRSVTVACSTTISGTHQGSLTVTGSTCVEGGTVSGPVKVTSGGALALISATLSGPLSVTGAASVLLCGTTASGPVTITGTTGPLTLGGQGGCSADKFGGPLQLTGNSGPVRIVGNTVGGPMTVSANTGPVLLSGNVVAGPLGCAGNAVAPQDGGVANKAQGPASGQCSGLV